MPVVKYKNLGLIDYKEAWEYQEKLFKGSIDQKIRIRKEESTQPTQNYILFCEPNLNERIVLIIRRHLRPNPNL